MSTSYMERVFECEGLRCIVRNDGESGLWHGYVRLPDPSEFPIPKSHVPWILDVEAPGGITFTGTLDGEDGYWYGFGPVQRSLRETVNGVRGLAKRVREWAFHPHQRWAIVHGDGEPMEPEEVDLKGHGDFRFIIDEYGVPAVLYYDNGVGTEVEWHGFDPDFRVRWIGD